METCNCVWKWDQYKSLISIIILLPWPSSNIYFKSISSNTKKNGQLRVNPLSVWLLTWQAKVEFQFDNSKTLSNSSHDFWHFHQFQLWPANYFDMQKWIKQVDKNWIRSLIVQLLCIFQEHGLNLLLSKCSSSSHSIMGSLNSAAPVSQQMFHCSGWGCFSRSWDTCCIFWIFSRCP